MNFSSSELLTSIHEINLDDRDEVSLVGRIAAPAPVFTVDDQAALDVVHVHVVELLDFLFSGPEVEIIEGGWASLRI